MTRRTALLILAAALLAGCSTMAEFGIGGDPLVFCRNGQAFLDDSLLGSDQARLTVMRRLKDADATCPKP